MGPQSLLGRLTFFATAAKGLEVQAGFGEGGDTGSDLFKDAHSALDDGDSFLEIEALGSGVLQCIGREVPGAHQAIGAAQHESHQDDPELGGTVVAVLYPQTERNSIADLGKLHDLIAAVEGRRETCLSRSSSPRPSATGTAT